MRRTVYPYSAYYREVLDANGARSRRRVEFARIPPTDLRLVADPGALVLRPDLGRIIRHGRPALAAWAAAALATGGTRAVSRHVQRRFKPVLWVLADDIPIGYSAEDVSRLARLGASWLRRAGARSTDVVVSLVPATPSVPYWQLVLGARRAGVSALHLGPTAGPDVLERLSPSVLVGEGSHLLDVLGAVSDAGQPLAALHTVVAVGPPLGAEGRARLRDLAGGAAVVGAWAPDGVRAVWSECRAGAAAAPVGYHAWEEDVLERATSDGEGAGAGELLWTGVGWAGSALLRLRTFAVAGIATGGCPACGARGQLVLPDGAVARADGPPAWLAKPSVPVAEVGPGLGTAGATRPGRMDHHPELGASLAEYGSVNGASEPPSA